MTPSGLLAILRSLLAPSGVCLNVETNLEVLVLVAVAVARVSFQFVCGEKTLRASCELASAEK